MAIKFQLSNTFHSPCKQHKVARGRIAGALLAFFCQGIDKKKSSLPLVPFNHNIMTITGANKLRSQLVGSARLDTKKQAGAPALQAP